jgi:hypothetical protein
MSRLKKAWGWSPAISVLAVCILTLWLSTVIWSQNQNFGNSTGGGTVSGAGSPTSAYTFFPSSSSTCALSNYSPSGTTYCALNNVTGAFDYSGTDAGIVINSAVAAKGTVGGRFFFKNGVYNVNSLVTETVSTCGSNFLGLGIGASYAIGIPAASGFTTSTEFIFEGEAKQVWQGEAGSASVNTQGVVINITATGVSSVTAGNLLNGFWSRPLATCVLQASNSTNDVKYHNLVVRFPVNTRGNEIQFNAWFADAVEYINDIADFATAYTTIASGSAPTVGTYNSIGMTTTVSSAGNYNHFQNTYVVGTNIAYDFQSEHITGITVTSIYNNIACEFGRSGTQVFHPSKIIHFVDQETGAGCIWGAQMQQGSITDVDFDFEFGNDANWYSSARAKTAKLSEVNTGYGTGILRYQAVLANSGVLAEIPAASLFTSGGQNFQSLEGTTSPNLAIIPAQDTFTHPNLGNVGAAWINTLIPNVCGFGITSNAATTGSAGACLFAPQAASADSDVKATFPTIDANGVAVILRGSTSVANQYNDFVCTTTTGMNIRKRIAGTFTNLATNATNCVAGDTLELKAVQANYFAYRNGTLVMTVTDASLTSGVPGLTLGGAGDSATNFSGGALPLQDAFRSISSQPTTTPQLISAGAVPIITGTGACATNSTQIGNGSLGGSFLCTGTTGVATIILTFAAGAPHEWHCQASDATTVADLFSQSAFAVTSCTISSGAFVVTTSDKIGWSAVAY